MLDVAPDDAMDMNKKRKMMRWDAKKRKFVKVCVLRVSVLFVYACMYACMYVSVSSDVCAANLGRDDTVEERR